MSNAEVTVTTLCTVLQLNSDDCWTCGMMSWHVNLNSSGVAWNQPNTNDEGMPASLPDKPVIWQ